MKGRFFGLNGENQCKCCRSNATKWLGRSVSLISEVYFGKRWTKKIRVKLSWIFFACKKWRNIFRESLNFWKNSAIWNLYWTYYWAGNIYHADEFRHHFTTYSNSSDNNRDEKCNKCQQLNSLCEGNFIGSVDREYIEAGISHSAAEKYVQ